MPKFAAGHEVESFQMTATEFPKTYNIWLDKRPESVDEDQNFICICHLLQYTPQYQV